MTVLTAQSLQSNRRASLRAATFGIAAGLLSALGAVHASPDATGAVPAVAYAQSLGGNAGIDPAKRLPNGVAVSGLDFKRGTGGSGKLIMRFTGDGAMPDMQTQGSSVIINVGNASLSPALQKPLNVTDFATPVQRIDANQVGAGSRIVLSTNGPFEPMAYQTGRDYVVEIVPRAAASKRAVGATTQDMQAGEPARIYSGTPVTFDFQSISVRTVLKIIADEAHLNIVASDTVQGDMTLRLDNVPWDQALDIVLQAKGLDKRRSGNVVWVAPQGEIAASEQAKADARIAIEERAEMKTEYIPVNYANAEDIAKLLTEESKGGSGGGGTAGGGTSQSRGFLSSRGSISFDRRTNTLLVIDIPARVENIKSLVSQLDRPVDQVVIEARIVIANESFARELGARFGISGSNSGSVDADGNIVGRNRYFSGDLGTNTDNINSGITAQNQYTDALRAYTEALRAWEDNGGENGGGPKPLAPSRIIPGISRGLNVDLPTSIANAGSLALSILNAGYLLDIELSALQQEQRGEVISNPRVVTANQREAVISQGREIGYVTVTGGQNANVPTVQFKEALLELKVTPTITNDGRVFLAMALKKDEIADYTTIAGVGSVPNLAKRFVNTAVLVEDGQTVVIGGVYEFTDRNSVSKVPFLGDIPFLGNLFKTKGRNKTKAELLVFVTPKVLRVAQRN